MSISYAGTCFTLDAAVLTDQMIDISCMCNSVMSEYVSKNVCKGPEFFEGLQKRLDELFEPHIFTVKVVDAETQMDIKHLGEFVESVAIQISPKYSYYHLSKTFN